MTTKRNLVLVFDLDDTLYKEISFLESAFKEIADFLSNKIDKSSVLILSEMIKLYNDGVNVFKETLKLNNVKEVVVSDLLNIYRSHTPTITLTQDVKKLLKDLKEQVYKVGLITDGRSLQQRNKIKALGLLEYFDDIIISEEIKSEKPCIDNYKYYVDRYGDSMKYVYIGDNTNKDFCSPKKLGWYTICLLDNGKNIHKQSFNEKEKAPYFKVNNLVEIRALMSQMN